VNGGQASVNDERSGVVEEWSDGVLEYWSSGVVEWWSIGMVECPYRPLLFDREMGCLKIFILNSWGLKFL